jgi:hypothetical protein
MLIACSAWEDRFETRHLSPGCDVLPRFEWCDRYVAKLDPGVQPIRQPKIKPPDYNDLREFRQRLGFSLRW